MDFKRRRRERRRQKEVSELRRGRGAGRTGEIHRSKNERWRSVLRRCAPQDDNEKKKTTTTPQSKSDSKGQKATATAETAAAKDYVRRPPLTLQRSGTRKTKEEADPSPIRASRAWAQDDNENKKAKTTEIPRRKQVHAGASPKRSLHSCAFVKLTASVARAFRPLDRSRWGCGFRSIRSFLRGAIF